MRTDAGHEEHHPKNRHLAEKMEGWVGTAMLAVIVILGVFLVYTMLTGAPSEPVWMR